MGTKSTDIAIVAPVCCAAAMLNSTRLALAGMVASAPTARHGGPLHKALSSMTAELEESLEHLAVFRELYDRHLGD